MQTMMQQRTVRTCQHTNSVMRPSMRVSRRANRVRVQAEQQKPEVAVLADNIGLPTDEGLFGFRPFAEVWTGRLAMMGFITSIVEEAMTGKGTLQQIGLPSPSSELLAALTALVGIVLLVGTADTINKAFQRKLSPKDIARYKNFLGLNSDKEAQLTAAKMKLKGDFTTPGDDLAAISSARAQGMPADRVLDINDRPGALEAEAETKRAGTGVLTLTKEEEAAQTTAAAADMKAREAAGPAVSMAAKADITEARFAADDGMAYARQVEITNGRWAMIGFLGAVLVEAGTGNGILGQLIMYGKLSGLLGAESGF
jgi:hypothetical protein